MERRSTRTSQSHNQAIFTMQASSERDEWQRTFPDPMPVGYELSYRWEGMALIVEPRLASAPPRETSTTAPDASELERLQSLSVADLVTLGAERGCKLSRTMSKAQMAGAILEAEAK
jgi:hypothetical protein